MNMPALRWFLAAPLLLLAGCVDALPQAQVTPVAAPPDRDEEEFREALDRVLEDAYQRELTLHDHAAWQILHGAVAYKRDFLVRDEQGKIVSAVDHILGGGRMKGWTVRPGTLFDPETGRRGLQAVLEPGTVSGQGHIDQWLSILASCGLPPEQTILLDGHTYTMADFTEQAMFDVPRNFTNEFSWTLIALTTYFPTDHRWTASDGNEWSVERLLELELEQPVNGAACGGTHRLGGIAIALNRHLAQGGELVGPWKQADELLQRHIHRTKELQNPDGTFSNNYYVGPGVTIDADDIIRTTGHAFEYLTLAMTDEQLREPWVRRAAEKLVDVFEKTRDMQVECGALYHAASGLKIYRERLYGPRSYEHPEYEPASRALSPQAAAGQ